MSNSYLLTATVGVSLGLVNTAMQTLTSASPLAVNRSLSYDMTERYRVETGPHGIGAKTCLEREYGSSAVKHLLFLEELPEDWQRSARADKRFMDKLYKVARDATPATRVTVHRDIRPAVREQVQELLRKARFGNSVDAKKALADAHALLAEDDSYAPAYLMVSRPRRESLGRGFSPGLGIVKVKRSDTLLHLDTEIITLPKAQPVE